MKASTLRSLALAGSVLGVAAFAAPASAITLLGNLPPGGIQTTTSISDDQLKGVGFTTPAEEYLLESVSLWLVGFDDTDQPSITIGRGPTPEDAERVVTLGSPDPDATSAAPLEVYSFTPTAPSTLEPETLYWLFVETEGGDYNWAVDDENETPTGEATFESYFFSEDAGASSVTSSLFNPFSIEVSLVDDGGNGGPPVEVSGTLPAWFAGAFMLLFAVRRRA